MKIYPILLHRQNAGINKNPINIQKDEKSTPNHYYIQNYNDYLLFFGARVDKGLERFYNVNKERMPDTVRDYVESLDSLEDITPMEAQRNALTYLALADSVEDIKAAYPEEPMFKNLKNPEDTKATKGLLYTMRDLKPILDEYGHSFLKDGENLTVYLLKKILLENKTIDEINDDLDEDLDADLKNAFLSDNQDSKYIVPSTIKALGIQSPELEYRTSLRFTVDGYSDMMGEKIAKAQKAFWESLSPEERTARARKSVRNFENWWNSIPHSKKLQMIADKQNELDLLKTFKEYTQKSSKKAGNSTDTAKNSATDGQTTSKTTVGSGKLSQDDLFKIWAKMNLEIYQESLSDSDKETIQLIRSERLAHRWQEMTPAQKTEFIEKLKAGLERHRYVMIDAWNNSFDIIKDLSAFLISRQIYKPANLLYSSEQFSEFQSSAMTEFWEAHPEHAKTFGNNLKKSYTKIKEAYNSGNLASLEREIDSQKLRRIRDLEKLKLDEKVNAGLYVSDYMPEYMQTFKDAYKKEMGAVMKYLPDSYNEDYFRIIKDNFSEEQVQIWSKNLLRQPLTEEDIQVLKGIMLTTPLESQYNNRALEGALAEILYGCTKHPIVYSLSFSDLKVALSQLDRKEKQIDIYSHSLRRRVNLGIESYKIDKKKIESLYNSYKKPLSEDELKNIAEYYFSSKDGKYDSLIEYLKTYGNSLNIVFSNKSVYPSDVKFEMVNRIMNNMPADAINNYDCYLWQNDDFMVVFHDGLKKATNAYYKEYNFIPSTFLSDIISGIQKTMVKKSVNEIIKMGIPKKIDVHSNLVDKLLEESDTDVKLKYLTMEQVLADILYEITGSTDVYSLGTGSSCDLLNRIQNAKKSSKLPKTVLKKISGEEIELNLQIKHKLPITKYEVTRRYQEYLEEINRRRNDYSQDWDMDELICALNPNEDAPEIDEAIKRRINKIKLTFDR